MIRRVRKMGRDTTARGGRGRDGQSNQGGRQRGRSQDKNNRTTSGSGKTKFFPHGYGREKTTLSYEVVKDHIIQFTQSTYRNGKDVADSLRLMSEVKLDSKIPIMGVSKRTDPEEKECHFKWCSKQKLIITYYKRYNSRTTCTRHMR
jgi:hypothetical protein